MTAHTTKLKRIISEMESTELNTGSEIRAYCDKARDALKSMAVELEFTATELQSRLMELPPEGNEGRMKVRTKARTCARHLRKSAKAARTAAAESTRTWASITRQFEYILGPVKPKKVKKTLNLKL